MPATLKIPTFSPQSSGSGDPYNSARDAVLRGLRGLPAHRETFREYVTRIDPAYRWYDCAVKVADALQRVADGELKRLMIFEPPRHGKSEVVSRKFPAYFLRRYPNRWVGLSSYGAELAYDLSRAARANYQTGGGRLGRDAHAVTHWETGDGGGMWATGVGGPATGKGFHVGIIDDPLKNWEEASSATIRSHQQDWYSSTWYTRLEPWGALVLVMTRWNEDDLAGWLTDPEAQEAIEPWHIIHLPSIRDDVIDEYPAPCTVEPDTREIGEALCPERYDVAALETIEQALSPAQVQALYRGRPATSAGLNRVYYAFRDSTEFVRECVDTGGDLLVGLDFNVNPMTGVVAVKAGNQCHVIDEIWMPDSGTPEMVAEINRRYATKAVARCQDCRHEWEPPQLAGTAERPVTKVDGAPYRAICVRCRSRRVILSPPRRIVCCPDPSGKARHTSSGQETDFSIIRGAGFTLRAPNHAPAVVDRVNQVNGVLQRKRLYIAPKCRKLRKALAALGYKPGTGNIDKTKGWDHITDALGYLVCEEFPVYLSGGSGGSGLPVG